VGLSVGWCSCGRHLPHVDDVLKAVGISSAGVSGERLHITGFIGFS
jgi:hypothetical protein